MKVRLRRPLDVISGCPQDVRSRRPRDVRLGHPRDGQIGPLGDVLGTLEGDVLETSWGQIFAGWETSSFNRKVTELENKIKTAESKPDISNLVTKTQVTNVKNQIPDSNVFVKKTDYDTEITGIKNDCVNNDALTSQLNDLKCQHIVDEVKK